MARIIGAAAPSTGAAGSASKGPPGKGGAGRAAEGKLAGIFRRNPATAVAVAGGGAVVLLALMMRSRGGAGEAPGTVPSDALQQFGGISGLYDTTANDVYNSLAGQMQRMQEQIAALQKPPAPGTPAPPAPKPPTPRGVWKPAGPSTGGKRAVGSWSDA